MPKEACQKFSRKSEVPKSEVLSSSVVFGTTCTCLEPSIYRHIDIVCVWGKTDTDYVKVTSECNLYL